MNLLQDIINYIRRIIKTPNNSSVSDTLIIDYINRFWTVDMSAEMQLFDLKTKYIFQTTPGIDSYNIPLYSIQTEPGAQNISFYPVYQGFLQPANVNGIRMPLYTDPSIFTDLWPYYLNQLPDLYSGNGSEGPYNITLLNFPAGPGHVDITGIIATGSNVDPILGTTLNTAVPNTSVYPGVYFTARGPNGQNISVTDSGQFLSNNTDGDIYGLLMTQGLAPFSLKEPPNGYGGTFPITGISIGATTLITLAGTDTFPVGVSVLFEDILGTTELNGLSLIVTASTPGSITVDFTTVNAYISGGTAFALMNVVNYNKGLAINVFFPEPIPGGHPIVASSYFFEHGIPRAMLFYNNILTIRPPPDRHYVIDVECYLTPTAFLGSGQAIQFAYMSEYIARGAARKILLDTGDVEQFQLYEPEFNRQRDLVWVRSQRQWTSTRTDTIFSNNGFQSNYNQSSVGT